jgi:hypothetical protein
MRRYTRSRRALSSTIATTFMFVMLFTIGTSYFLFVNNLNQQYTQNLQSAQRNLQGGLSESLTVSTVLLTSNSHVGFYVNNTASGSVTSNVTIAMVLASNGAILSCSGKALKAGSCSSQSTAFTACTNASCSTTASPAPNSIGVKAGKGSPVVDTGYTYVAATTVVVRVLTNLGSAFAMTYPPTSQYLSSVNANTAQTLTVDPTTFKWTTIAASSSSLAQSNYVANCNSASCGAAYGSSVTVGNTLVYALGWYNQAPPSTPTDTRGSTFSLGVSSSVAAPITPSLVQQRYASNCNALNCGLAYSSNVASGNTLVFGLGWFGQSPPSAPTDTRGDTFVLGASQSVTYNPPATSVVQSKYLANCNAAACGLGYTSNVAAGDTLVYGLGWFSGGSTYVPITITNNQASATANPFQELVTWNPSSYSTYEASDLGNIRFCADTGCATTYYSWLESCTSTCNTSATSATAWVKLTSAISGSGGQLTVYMVFKATTVDFDGVYAGEAPNLSATYGQFDNGANVFTAYFDGNTATSSFSTYSGYTLAKQTGVTYGSGTISALQLTGYNGNTPTLVFNAAMSNAAMISESNFENNHVATDMGAAGFVNNAAAASVNNAIGVNEGYSSAYFNQDYISAGTYTSNVNPQGTAATAWLYATATYLGSAASTYTGVIAPQLYSSTGGYSGTVSANPVSGATNLYLGFVGSSSVNYQTNIYFNWDRARVYPPSNVMPGASFGSLTGGGSNPPSGPTDTLGDSYTLGASQSVSYGVTPSVVQQRYASNCNSANCALAYSSNVAAGNTLVFGLGWYATTAYIPITITNNQGTATPTTFQQKVTWNPSTYSAYEASNLGNIRFCADTACATTYYSWLESCTSSCTTSATSASAWVKLTSSIAGSGGQKVIYMFFQATNVNFDTNYWGEAPNLSGTYGQYDNGANVFNFYDNFAGTTLSNKWTTVKSSGGSVTVNNGATFTTAANTDYAFVDSATQTYPQVAESYMVSRGGTTDPMLGVTTSSSANNHPALYNGYSVELLRFSGTDYLVVYAETSGGATLGPYNANGFNAGIWQVIWSATGTESATDGVNSLTSTDTTATIGNYGIYLGQTANSAGSNVADWGRLRAYPPSNVMPSTSFGSVTGGLTPSSVTDTLGDTFTLGPSTSVTSGATTYYSYVWYATSASAGADTITAAFSSAVTGSVSVYEVSGVTTTAPSTSVGSSQAGSTAPAVTSFTPSTNSIIIGNAETGASTSAFTAGTGFTLSGTCAAVYGCGESRLAAGAGTTVPFSLLVSAPWVDAAIAFAPSTTTYNSYIWYTTAASAGADTITATFPASVTGSVSIYELAGVTTAGAQSSTGSSSTGSSTISVTSFTPATNSIVIGNSETASSSSTFTAGTGFTLSGACTTVYGCGEYKTGVGTATTAQMTLGASAAWAEAAVSFAPATSTTYYSYIWYTTAASSGADTITAAFGSTVAGSVSIYEYSGATTTGVLSSTGSSSSFQTSSSVGSFTPSLSSVIVGNAETASTTFTAGSGFTLVGTCASVNGCAENQMGSGSATTVPITFSSGGPWVEAAVAFAPNTNTYYSYIWYAPAASTGADTITATFSQSVTGSVAIYELVSVWTTGTVTSTGSSGLGSTSAAVGSMTPGGSSIVIANTETTSTTMTAGSGFTLANSGTCSSVYGCSEYQTGVNTATTAPMTLNPSAPWVEVAIAFPGAPAQNSGQQVGGYPAMAVPYSQYLHWQVQFTNQDAQGRSVTLWPKSLAALESIIQETVEITPFFIIDGVSLDGTTLIAYNTTQNFITIPYKGTATVHFGAFSPRSTTPDRFDTSNEIAPFTGFFALEGIYSDKTLFGLTVPYPAGMVTQANAKVSPTAAANGVTVTASCNSPCNFPANTKAFVGWMDSKGVITTVKTFTIDGSGNIPSGVTFQVPTAPVGFYTIVVSDYVNTVFMTFQHT